MSGPFPDLADSWWIGHPPGSHLGFALALGSSGQGFVAIDMLGDYIAGAAVTVMLSGYAAGGQIGLPLAAALAGAMIALMFETRAGRGIGPLGVPLVVFCSLLVLGRFFGPLTRSRHCSFMCSVTGLAPRTPLPVPTAVMGPWVARVVLVTAVVLIVVVRAQTKFDHDFGTSSCAAKEPSIQDYLDFGK